MIQDIIKKATEELNNKKETVMTEKFLEATGLDLKEEIFKESKRMFSKIKIIKQRDEESLYYDNGTIEGLRIVTFIVKSKLNPLNFKDNGITGNIEISYY